QRAYEACGVLAAHGIGLGELAPPAHCSRVVLRSFCALSEPLQCTGVAAVQTCTLGVQPSLELRCVAEIKTVQEWPSVFLYRPFEIATLERALELTDVAADHNCIQTHRIHARKHGLVYRAADRVQQLLQRMPRARLRRIRPEEKEQLITAASLLPSCGKHSEQRQSPVRSEEHTSELQSRGHLVCRLLLEK